MPRTIHHTFGPHIDRKTLLRMLRLSYSPWNYAKGPAPAKLKAALRTKFHAEPFLFASGRQSLLALLRAMHIRAGEEVIVQGYTCVVVPNAIHAAGGVPVYADIDENTLNLTMESVKSCLTDRTRAVIVQHTFGIPGPAKELKELLHGKGISLIESLAHVMPDETGPHEIGTSGDFLILSFGRDKAISGVSGGALLSRNDRISPLLIEAEKSAEYVPLWTVLKHLEYGTRMHSLVRPLAGTVLLKVIIRVLHMINLIELVVTKEEKKGRMPVRLQKIPNACAELALASLQNLKKINDTRRLLVKSYLKHAEKEGWQVPKSINLNLPLQKLPMFVRGAEAIRKELMKEKIFLHDGWSTCVICPENVEVIDAGYEAGTDPVAENACLEILSLPSHPTMTLFDAERLSRRITEVLKNPTQPS